jgi:protein YIPF6
MLTPFSLSPILTKNLAIAYILYYIYGRASNMSTTLNESVQESIMRDLMQIKTKLFFVFSLPSVASPFKDWDLWGPFLICLALSAMLSYQAGPSGQSIFSLIFTLFWIGSSIVTLNAGLLRGKISFFHTLSVLGYCLAPITAAAGSCFIFDYLGLDWLKVLPVIPAYLYGAKQASAYVAELMPDTRKILAIYPIYLLYANISLVVLMP